MGVAHKVRRVRIRMKYDVHLAGEMSKHRKQTPLASRGPTGGIRCENTTAPSKITPKTT